MFGLRKLRSWHSDCIINIHANFVVIHIEQKQSRATNTYVNTYVGVALLAFIMSFRKIFFLDILYLAFIMHTMNEEFRQQMRYLSSKPRSPHKKYCLKYTKQDLADALGIHRNSLYSYCKKNNIVLKSLSLLELVNLINSLSKQEQ